MIFNNFAEWNPTETFYWLKEPLCNNLVILYKQQYLIPLLNTFRCSNLEIAEPLDCNSGTLVENHWNRGLKYDSRYDSIHIIICEIKT